MYFLLKPFKLLKTVDVKINKYTISINVFFSLQTVGILIQINGTIKFHLNNINIINPFLSFMVKTIITMM